MVESIVSVVRKSRLIIVVALLLAAWPSPSIGQEITVNEEAERIFDQALDAYEAGDFGMASRRFQIVVNSYPLHSKTTAAWLMAGNALYRNADYEQTIVWLDELVQTYPSSRYAREALTISTFARETTSMNSDRSFASKMRCKRLFKRRRNNG